MEFLRQINGFRYRQTWEDPVGKDVPVGLKRIRVGGEAVRPE